MTFKLRFKSKQPDAGKPGSTDPLLEEAKRAYRAKDFVRTLEVCEKIIAIRPDDAEAQYRRGNALKDLGRLPDALAAYDVAVKHRPDFAHAWCNMGVVQQALKSHDKALASYDRAIAIDSTDAISHVNRGALLQAAADWSGALSSYDRALALSPTASHVWFHRGNVLREAQRPQDALASYSEAVKLEPNHAEAHYNCGVLLERAGKQQDALASYDQAIALNPDFSRAHFNRAGLLKASGQKEAALIGYDRAVAVDGGHVEAHLNRGVVLQEMHRYAEAWRSYDLAISLRSDNPQGYFNRGTLHGQCRQWDLALADFSRAIALRPRYAAAYCEQARVLMQLSRVDEALMGYQQAVAMQPDFAEAQYNMALALLLSGDFARGWSSYEWRWKNADRLAGGALRSFRKPLWLGDETIAGKTLFVYSEQGFGDTLQFCRFIKLVEQMGVTVVLEVQEPLKKLLSGLDGVSQVTALGDPPPQFDMHCPLMSLPLALKIEADTIPSKARYLPDDEAKTERWRQRLSALRRPRIGLTWSGNPKQGHDHDRSIRLAELIPYLPREFCYVSLQKEIRISDFQCLRENPWIERFDAEWHDFSDAAALCDCVDLVISVCTSVAHLSSALGRPTWILLPFVPDWRWLLDRNDSPWYPTARLYRQERIGDWQGVLSRVQADLQSGAADGDLGR